MKAITVCEPFASAIIYGPKRVENRGKPWRFRGRLLIHAGKSRKYMEMLSDDELATWPEYDQSKLVFGHILGSVEVYDCVLYPQAMDDVWACGPYCLLLRDPEPLEKPIPYRGQLGLFEVPDELIANYQEPTQ